MLLLGAFALMVGVPRAFDAGVPGAGFALPPPSPPPVGSCLDLRTGDVTQVPCGGPHNAEVTAIWPAGETSPCVAEADRCPTVSGLVLLDDSMVCGGISAIYLEKQAPDRVAVWTPYQPTYATPLVRSPADGGLPDRRWTACLVTASSRTPFDGSLTGALRSDDWPAAFRSCAIDTVPIEGELVVYASASQIIGCDLPHRVELLGSATVEFGAGLRFSDLDDDELQASCLRFAAERVGVSDPTFGGRLRAVSRGVTGVVTRMNEQDAPLVAVPDCYLEVVGNGLLTSTLIGLDGAPLPLG